MHYYDYGYNQPFPRHTAARAMARKHKESGLHPHIGTENVYYPQHYSTSNLPTHTHAHCAPHPSHTPHAVNVRKQLPKLSQFGHDPYFEELYGPKVIHMQPRSNRLEPMYHPQYGYSYYQPTFQIPSKFKTIKKVEPVYIPPSVSEQTLYQVADYKNNLHYEKPLHHGSVNSILTDPGDTPYRPRRMVDPIDKRATLTTSQRYKLSKQNSSLSINQSRTFDALDSWMRDVE